MDMVLEADLKNLIEVTREFAQAKLMGRPRTRLKADMERMFKAQQKIVLKGLAKLKDTFEESVTPNELASIVGLAEDKTSRLAENAVEKAARAGLLNGSKALISELNIGMSFTLANPRAISYLDFYGAKKVTQINETTRSYIKSIVKQSADEGWSYNRTAKAIGERYSQMWVGKPQAHIASRAHFIAVTETGNAYMEGQLAVGHELMASGLPMEKSWSTMNDGNVSDGCRENEDAGWIDLAKSFPSGNARPLRFPGCRCDLLQRVSEKARIKPPETLEGYKWDYGINPGWTPEQRLQFIQQNAKITTRSMKGRPLRKLTDKQIRAQEHALNNLARQPDEVVSSFLKRGEIALTENEQAFANMYGRWYKPGVNVDLDEVSNVVAYYQPWNNRIVMRSSGKWSIGTQHGMTTFDHEMGHYIHYWSKTESKKFFGLYNADDAFDRFTNYAKTNAHEGFAESYEAWMNSINRGGADLPFKFGQITRRYVDEDVIDIFKMIEKAALKVRK